MIYVYSFHIKNTIYILSNLILYFINTNRIKLVLFLLNFICLGLRTPIILKNLCNYRFHINIFIVEYYKHQTNSQKLTLS